MLDSKSIIDLYTDWCIAYVANVYNKTHEDSFIERYFASISKVVEILNRHLHTASESKTIRNAYAVSGDDIGYVPYNELIDRVYLKGGCVADHYGGVAIKPSDIDCSIVFSPSNVHKLLDEAIMAEISTELGKELFWFHKLLPNINEHEDFYDLLEAEGGDIVNIFNSYSNKLVVEDEYLDSAYTNLYNRIYYSQTMIKHKPTLLITRFFWKNILSFRGSTFMLKINIVDLSAHVYHNAVLSYPRLTEELIHGHKIWTENIYAMLNDQLETYAGGVLRNDKKLIKRKTRVFNIVNNLSDFSQVATLNLNNKDLRKYMRENFSLLVQKVLSSTEMYPYIILVFLLIASQFDFYQELKKISTTPDKLLLPQSAVFDKAYEFYDLPQKNDVISENIRLRLEANKSFVKSIMDKIRNKKSTNKMEYVLAGDSSTLPTEDQILNCIKTCDKVKLSRVVRGNDKLYDRWMRLRTMSDYAIIMYLTDDDYNLYIDYMRQQ